MKTRTIVLEKAFPYPLEQVWTALTNQRALAEWLMPNDFEPEHGSQFVFRVDPSGKGDGVTYCEIEQIEDEINKWFSRAVNFTKGKLFGGWNEKFANLTDDYFDDRYDEIAGDWGNENLAGIIAKAAAEAVTFWDSRGIGYNVVIH